MSARGEWYRRILWSELSPGDVVTTINGDHQWRVVQVEIEDRDEEAAAVHVEVDTIKNSSGHLQRDRIHGYADLYLNVVTDDELWADGRIV